jgi:hypothetical protein
MAVPAQAGGLKATGGPMRFGDERAGRLSDKGEVALAFVACFIEFVDVRNGQGVEVGIGDIVYRLRHAMVLDQGLEHADQVVGLVF